MKIDFNITVKLPEIVKFSDAPNGEIHVGEKIAGALFTAGHGDSIKLVTWANLIYDRKPLDLDDSDKKTLYEFIEKLQFPAILKAAALRAINEAKK